MILLSKRILCGIRCGLFIAALVCYFQTNAQPGNKATAGLMLHYDTVINAYRYSKPDSALILINKALAIAHNAGDKNGQALMLNQLGMLKDNQGKYPEAGGAYSSALQLYQGLGNLKGMATETYRLGVDDGRNGKYAIAISKHLTALGLSERIHDNHGKIEANLGLTDAYIPQKQYDIALHYLKIADSINRQVSFSNLNLTIGNAYGVIYRETGKFDLGKKYVLASLGKSNLPKFNGSHITLLNTLASIYTKQGKLDSAIILQKEALVKSHEISNYIREMESLFNLAASYKNIQPRQSIIYLEQARAFAIKKADYAQQIKAILQLAIVYEALGNYRAALMLQKEQFQLSNQIYFKQMAAQISGLQAAYELKKSQLRVQQLSEINKKDLLERKILIGMGIGAMLVLLLISGLYYKIRSVNSTLKSTNTVKDKLLSVMAHDLRSPFISIVNLLGLIKVDGLDPDEQHDLFQKLEITSLASLETIDSILTWGQMQMKGIQTNPTTFALKPLFTQAIGLLLETAGYKHIAIRDLSGAEITLFADLEHVSFIIRNLLSNAVKFTNTGGKIHCLAEKDANTQEVTITIMDNGVGIAAARLPHIFDMDNVSTAGTFNEKGTSMGLLVCKEFAASNKGRISVSSEVGVGSHFYLTLPAGKQ